MTLDFVDHTAICGLEELARGDRGPFGCVLSILNPDREEPETPWGWPPHQRLTLRFHDEIDQRPGEVLPEPDHVALILAFGRVALKGAAEQSLLIHCQSGVSRSTAAAVMIWAQDEPDRDETEILARLRRVRPQAWPNSLMLAFADAQLGRRGRLIAAATAYFRESLQADPALEARMRRLRRSRDIDIALERVE